ncbi:GNAT family N-acetyltransferase [Microbispora sp. NPDC049125]|uniref:GNAT family N-acetyltransferase n=1 Tax=Microbispora sp. NPDC049125 TaxID=3154929 RepID=UPI003466FBBE
MTATMPSPVTLHGRAVRLVPLTLDHAPGLLAAGGGDEEIWRWRPSAPPASQEAMRRHIASLLERQAGGRTVPFAVVLRTTGEAIGSTCFHDVEGFDESVEIGSTWYGKAHWGTGVNAECKVLLLDHAFGPMAYTRVMLRTDVRNLRSRAAIERIGGTLEGVLRRQYRRRDGTWRDSAVYSILDDEWPAHRARLTGTPSPAEYA